MQEKDARESGRTCWNAIQLRELLHELAPFVAEELKRSLPK